MPKVRRCREQGCHKVISIDHYYCDEHKAQEALYIKSRQKWARSRDASYRHKYDAINRNRSELKRDQYQFYRSKKWRGLRSRALIRDNYIDQYLKLFGIYEQANTVDHIVPIEFAPQLKAELSNLVSCGRYSHLIKSRWERQYYFDSDGNPKDVEPVTQISDIVTIIAPLGLLKGEAHT